MKWLDPAWWIGLEQLIALQCPSSANGNYGVLILAKDQNRISVKHAAAHQTISEVDALLKAHSKTPIVLVLENEFVMEALILPDQLSDPVSGVLGVKIEDPSEFQYMEFTADGGGKLVAVIRTTTVEAALAPVQGFEERVISTVFSLAVVAESLGAISGKHFSDAMLVECESRKYLLRNGLFSHQEDAIGRNPETVSLKTVGETLALPVNAVYPYAALLHVWERSMHTAHIPLETRFRAYLQVSRLRQLAVAGSFVLAIWFLGLFFMRLQLENRKSQLEDAYAHNLPVLDAIDRLDEKIALRERLNEELGNQTLRASVVSFYLDRIATVLPSEVNLCEIVVSPREEDFKRNGITDSSDCDIIIRGESGRSAPLTSFSRSVDDLPWVQKLEIAKSELDIQGDQYQFVFLIQSSDNNSDLH